MELTSAVVSVRQPRGALPVFTRARDLSRTRHDLRQRHPNHLASSAADVTRFRTTLVRRLILEATDLTGSRREGWMEMLGVLIGDLEGSAVGVVSRVSRRL